MTTYPWMKLYIEILDDPKVGMMPDWEFRRFIQFLLAAREYNHDGLLGPIAQLAWRLRSSEDDLFNALRTLSEIGIVAESPDGWMVVNFKKRQYSESYERMKRYRERNKQRNSYGESDAERYGMVTEHESTSTSSSDSRGEGVGEGTVTVPQTPLGAAKDPDIVTFREVSGRLPGISQYKTVIETIQYIRGSRKLTYETAITYLKPYWLAWSTRKRQNGNKYYLNNLTWLTEWAVNGSIPSPGQPDKNLSHPPSPEETRKMLDEKDGKYVPPPEEVKAKIRSLKLAKEAS